MPNLTPSSTPPPPRPRLRLEALFALRQSLYQLLEPHLGQILGPETHDQLAHRLARRLDAPSGAVYDSLPELVGLPLTAPVLREAAWRLAANRDRLLRNQPTRRWARQVQPEWIAFTFLQVRPHVTGRGKFGGFFRVQALSGTLAARTHERFFSRGFCHVLALRLGFCRSGALRLEDMREFLGLRFLALVQASMDYRDGIALSGLDGTPSLVRYNQGLLTARSLDHRLVRGARFVCPFRYRHACYKCPKGIAECPVAIQSESLPVGVCAACQQPRYLAERTQKLCYSCWVASRWRHHHNRRENRKEHPA